MLQISLMPALPHQSKPKKKRHHEEQASTLLASTTRPDTVNPEYNEQFRFEVR
jgi:hypothetical protein